MPNAIYPPHWHSVPPAKHPALWRWAGLILILALLAWMLIMLRPAG